MPGSIGKCFILPPCGGLQVAVKRFLAFLGWPSELAVALLRYAAWGAIVASRTNGQEIAIARINLPLLLYLVESARYVLLKAFRALVTVKVPSLCADTLIQYAVPLCAGGGFPAPGGGGGVGATGMAVGCSSNKLAMKSAGTVNSWPLRREK